MTILGPAEVGAGGPGRRAEVERPVGLPGPPAPVRALGPAGAIAVAVAVAVGAVAARPLSLLVPAAVVLLAAVVRRPLLLVVAGALAASALGARAVDGLVPSSPGPVEGPVTLVSDPEARWGRVEAVARLGGGPLGGGRLVQVRADGPSGEAVAARLAGERLAVTGRLSPLPDDVDWLRVRHVSARLEVDTATPGGQAAAPFRAANHLRRLLDRGAETMGDERRALYLGLVLGDDRFQSPEATDDFRASGLAHLLAVSGQNVAFVLLLATPLLRRLSLGGRLAAVVAVLALFAVVTRFEPSVLRAVAMAGVAAATMARGRPTSALQVLALAAAGLILIDPLLVHSVGFRLSLAATVGILVIGPRLVESLPGPPAVVLPVAVSAGAQLGVAPLLVGGFGGVPVVALPANLLAAPAAAVVMTWGLPAGALAGLAGPPLDGWLHAPTALAARWLGGVARTAASAPLGQLGWLHLALLVLAVAMVVVAGRAGRSRRALLIGAAAIAVVALAEPGLALRDPPRETTPAEGVRVWRAGATVVVIEPGTGPSRTLEGLRLAGVLDVDLLLVGPGATAADEERAARHRSRIGQVWWVGRDPPGAVRVGDVDVTVSGVGSVCVRPPGRDPCPS